MVSEISAVTFDVGGTLIKPHPSVGHIYAAAAARQGVAIEPAVLNYRFAKAWKEFRNFNHARIEWAALVDQTFAGLLPEKPSETFFPELYDEFAEPAAWHIFEDVKPALDALAARGLNLGIISNWDERLRPLLDKMDLAKYFEFIVISSEVGFTKPSPVIFELAARKLGLPPEKILHVGDSRKHDVEGATGAGFQARLLEREIGPRAEGEIGSLSELEGL
jgi:putative hydrolase of the HAD superfamily